MNFKKKIVKYKAKYRMFHPKRKNSQLGELILRSGINELLKYLEDDEKFDEKTVIAADYLTTMYQLFDLKEKYVLK